MQYNFVVICFKIFSKLSEYLYTYEEHYQPTNHNFFSKYVFRIARHLKLRYPNGFSALEPNFGFMIFDFGLIIR